MEKRKQPRIEVKWPIAVLTGQGTIEGETKNISPEGIYICCEKPLQIDEVFRMYLLPPNHNIIWVTGKVVWSKSHRMKGEGADVDMGIYLVKISDEDRHFLIGIV